MDLISQENVLFSFTWLDWRSFRICWTSWLNGFISEHAVNFNRNLIGYGYEGEGIDGTGGDVSMLGVITDGKTCERAGWFNGSNISRTDNALSIPILIKSSLSIFVLLELLSTNRKINLRNKFFYREQCYVL